MSESKTPTPRTDAAPKTYRYRSRASGLVYSNPNAAGDCDALIYVDADFARTLELELNEASSKLVYEWDQDETPSFRAGGQPPHELEELVTAERCNQLVSLITDTRAQLTTAQQEIAELRKREAVHNQWAASGQMVAKDYFAELEKDRERLDWLENNGVEIGISALAYYEISATRLAIDKGMREIQTKDSEMKGTRWMGLGPYCRKCAAVIRAARKASLIPQKEKKV